MMDRLEEMNRKMQEDPRYIIELLANDEGKVKVYFSPSAFRKYLDGGPVKGSTESFAPDDVIAYVPMEIIDEISHGGTIVHL
jgi:hypothetical protein